MITPNDELQKARFLLDAILIDENFLSLIDLAVEKCCKALWAGNKIMFCGNGGSAADSQHLAAELVSKLNFDRPGLSAVALTTDTSILTAIGNDYGFDCIFSRQIKAIGKTGDILIALSTSGNSRNVLHAIGYAKASQITTIGFTGKNGTAMGTNCDLLLKIPSSETQKIQECHIMIGHIIAGMIEERMFPR